MTGSYFLVSWVVNRELSHRRVKLKQSLINTNQGSQNQTDYSRLLLVIHRITSSSLRTIGSFREIAMVESSFSTLKEVQVLDDGREAPILILQLRHDLAFCIEGYYNRERRLSSTGCLRPTQSR
jgi:hypothetical protein